MHKIQLLLMNKIILASQSPRRAELLSSLGYSFEVMKINCEEIYPKSLTAKEIAPFLSKLKAESYQTKENEVLLTADTIVSLNEEVLEKPSSKEEAKKMLEKLSGKKHQVHTAICIKTNTELISKIDTAEVEFNEFSKEEIGFYVGKYNPLDKAGAYGIQEWIGMAKIKSISGSFYTIMGLPTHLVYETLSSLGIKTF